MTEGADKIKLAWWCKVGPVKKILPASCLTDMEPPRLHWRLNKKIIQPYEMVGEIQER